MAENNANLVKKLYTYRKFSEYQVEHIENKNKTHTQTQYSQTENQTVKNKVLKAAKEK